MSNREFYQETFSQVQGTAKIRWEDYEMRRRGKSLRWFITLAASVALLAALSALAVAANFFGLRDVLLPEQGRVHVTDEQGVVVPGEFAYTDFVSLSGWMDTPESRALSEWRAFADSYDQDGAIVRKIGNSPTGFEEDYGLYLVYTQEMADKLEEVVDKYNLKLHSWMEDILPETWPIAAGDFFGENVTPYTGYIYENGTFRFDGDAELGAGELKGYGTIEYQFSRSVKGTFDDVTLNIGDIGDFEEWGHIAADGTPVTLGLGDRNRSLILADLGDSFVLVNVLTGRQGDDTFSSGPIGREELEALADSFFYSALTPVREPDREALLNANARYMETLENQPAGTLPSESEDPLYTRTGIRSDVARDFVLLLAERMEDGRREEIADLLVYPAQVETAGGSYTVHSPEEFLRYYDGTVGQSALSLAADMAWEPAPSEVFSDGSGLASAANGAVWFGLVEDGVIRIFTLQTDQWSIRAGSGTITQDGGGDLYEALSLDEGREFLLNLADLIDQGEREEIAGLLTYPAQVKAPGGEWMANTPEEFLECYDETFGTGGSTLSADLRADPEPVLDSGGGLASALSESMWFGRMEGRLQIFSLRSDVWLWSIRYLGEGP
ncbi:MAG: hypothetical protein HFG05_09445 [Oscillibacter sp.]|nr:hypothetical protein [Oscillibacter sp.]